MGTGQFDLVDFAKRTSVRLRLAAILTGILDGPVRVCNAWRCSRQAESEYPALRVTESIDQVHRVLGQYRDDDVRSGWISGLDEEVGRCHPTAGGLRIGKPLKDERE